MKNFITILILSLPVLAVASENCFTTMGNETVEEQMEIKTDVPKYLEGATIIVRMKDGKETSVPAEKFKVVPRRQQFIVTKTKQIDKLMCSAEANKNRVSLLAGEGPTGKLDRSRSSDTVSVEENHGAVGGAQYQRLITERVSVGAQVQSNETVLVNVGLDF